MRFQYDPFEKEEDAERERELAAKAEHEEWSRQQSLKGNSAAQREPGGVWIKRLPDEIGRT